MLEKSFEEIFTFENMHKAMLKCQKGKRWKRSVQSFTANKSINIAELQRKLISGEYKSRGFDEFDIIERGKKRHIKSVDFEERIVQRCLCDEYLVPSIEPHLIYHNSANRIGKGTEFARKELLKHLRKFYAKNDGGYVLKMDFRKYFDSIDHMILKEQVRRYISDRRTVNLIEHFIDMFGNKVGLGLGSQVSQILAVAYPNEIDHFIKEKLHIKYYGRYMDDAYLIHESKEKLKKCLEEIEKLAKKLKLQLHPCKTKIIPLKDFEFLKVRYITTESGKIVLKPDRNKIIRMRRKVKAVCRAYLEGKRTENDIYECWQSWDSSLQKMNAFKIRREIKNLIFEMTGIDIERRKRDGEADDRREGSGCGRRADLHHRTGERCNCNRNG